MSKINNVEGNNAKTVSSGEGNSVALHTTQNANVGNSVSISQNTNVVADYLINTNSEALWKNPGPFSRRGAYADNLGRGSIVSFENAKGTSNLAEAHYISSWDRSSTNWILAGNYITGIDDFDCPWGWELGHSDNAFGSGFGEYNLVADAWGDRTNLFATPAQKISSGASHLTSELNASFKTLASFDRRASIPSSLSSYSIILDLISASGNFRESPRLHSKIACFPTV